MKTLSSIARPAYLLALGVALAAISLPNGARAQDTVDAALARQVEGAKISLERGLAAAKARGKPISAKYEVEDGKLQLSVYTAKAGHFAEVIVNHKTGKIAKAEEIKEGEDLTAAKSQNEAMGKAKRTLGEALSRALRANRGYRAVSVTADMQNAKPVASIVLVSGTSSKAVTEPLD